MKYKKIICAIISVMILQIGSVKTFAIDEHDDLLRSIIVQDGSELSVIDCVATAFKNSPKIKRDKYNLDIAKSNLGIAKSEYFPVISAGVGYYHENNSNKRDYDSYYRELPNVGVVVNQLVYNFGKSTARIKMEEFYKIGAEYEFMDSLCHTLFDVKLKYYELLRQQALLKIATNNLELCKHFLTLAKNKKNADKKTAELNISNAEVNLIEANTQYNNAKLDLSNAMYLPSQPNYTIKDTQTFAYQDDYAYMSGKGQSKTFEPVTFIFPLEKAVDIAYNNSPDLQVLINTKNAMEQSLKFIKKSYLPDITASAGYGYLNTNNKSTNNGLTVGVNMSTSINLMELKHSIKGANAQLNLADNEIELFKKDLYFEVKRALNNVDKAKNQIITSKLGVEQAIVNLKYVEDEYKSDKLNYIALQDARKDYINSLMKYIDVLYDYNNALIQLERAMHYHIVDIHHKSEHAMHYHSNELIKHLIDALNCDEKEVKNKLKNNKNKNN